MKPLYLLIKGFGPYLTAEIKEEDFQYLIKNKLFLISGEIGAGKTTIFDAILYALYGESTIEGRNPSDLISHFIRYKRVIPEIDFKFSLEGKTYRIIRRPPFEGRAESVHLWIENKIFSSKKNEIQAKIKELIGLDPKQFKKVFLIPQGEYRKILIAKKEERKSLLETVFETFIFSNLEELLKNKIKKIQEEYQNLTEKEENLKKIAQISSLEELKNKIVELENKQKNLKEKLKIYLNKKEKIEKEIKDLENISQLYKDKEDLLKRLSNLKNKEEEIKFKEKLLEKLKALKDHYVFFENFEKLKNSLKDNYLKRKKLINLLEKITNNLKILEDERKNHLQNEKIIEEKKQELKRLEELENYFAEKEKLQKRLENLTHLLENKIQTLKNLQEQIKLIEDKKDKLSEKKDKLNRILIITKKKEIIGELINKFEEYEKIIPELKKTEKNKEKLKEDYEKLKKVKEELKIKNQAYFLAKFLKEGEPCPVCGSKIHPNPIKGENFLENLELIEKEIRQKEELLEKEKGRYYTLKAKKENLEKALQNKEKDALLKEYEKIEEELLQFPQDYLFGISENEIISWEKEIKTLKTHLDHLKNKERKLTEEIETLKSEKISSDERLNLYQGFLKNFSSFEEFKSQKETLKRKIEGWERKKEDLEKKITSLKEKEITTETELKNTKELFKKELTEYKKVVFRLLRVKNDGFITSIKDFKNYISMIPQIKDIEEEVQTYFSQIEIIESKIEEINKRLENYKNMKENLVISELHSKYKEKESLERSIGEINKEVGSLESNIRYLQEVFTAYQKIEADKKSLEKEYPLLESLYNLIVGKNKKGVSFHSYVLSLFTQLILKRANFYLKEFSFGRYKFIEDEILQKKFNLEVFDYYTGSKRDTKTLSGGESFLATLSLALGTSDVILRLYRTRPFESLFIDEGFGSLDENTLEKVVNTLLNLAHHSGRIIGIISHLKDLKDKFSAVVEVYKNQFSGSYIKINKFTK